MGGDKRDSINHANSKEKAQIQRPSNCKHSCRGCKENGRTSQSYSEAQEGVDCCRESKISRVGKSETDQSEGSGEE